MLEIIKDQSLKLLGLRIPDTYLRGSVIFACPIQFPFIIALAEGFSFIVFALAAGQGQSHFGLSLLKIKLQRDQGEAFFVDLAIKPLDLMCVQQQLAGPQGIVVVIIGKGVGADMHLMDKNLSIGYSGVGIFQVDPAQPKGFDLGPLQDHSSLEFIFDKIVVAGLAVDGNNFNGLIVQWIPLPCCYIKTMTRSRKK